MWDLPGPEHDPMSPALAGGFLPTAPLGKPKCLFFCVIFWKTLEDTFFVCVHSDIQFGKIIALSLELDFFILQCEVFHLRLSP